MNIETVQLCYLKTLRGRFELNRRLLLLLEKLRLRAVVNRVLLKKRNSHFHDFTFHDLKR